MAEKYGGEKMAGKNGGKIWREKMAQKMAQKNGGKKWREKMAPKKKKNQFQKDKKIKKTD